MSYAFISIIVKNEGGGITIEQASRLFQPFGQADASVKRKYGGSGLGLIISRQLARAMGGDVAILSTEAEKGAIFEITVVLERSQKSLMEPSLRNSQYNGDALTAKFPGKRILAADDARDNLVLLEMFLRGSETQLTFATNGEEAYELCQKNNYDIVLMNIQMPEMDGLEATAAIRTLGQQMPIVALTAYATRIEYDKCRKAGCNDALVKPISKNNLIKALQHYLE